MTSSLGAVLVLFAWATLPGQQRQPRPTTATVPSSAPGSRASARQQGRTTTNNRSPRRLRAVQLLASRAPGVEPRVQFEWDQVSGAHEYLLSGKWTGTQSWTMRSREFHVMPANATTWDAQRVTFAVSLPQGSHSWKVVALFNADDVPDLDDATTVSFDLR